MQQRCLTRQRLVTPISSHSCRLTVSSVRPKPRFVARSRCSSGKFASPYVPYSSFALPSRQCKAVRLNKTSQVFRSHQAEQVLYVSEKPARFQRLLLLLRIAVALASLPLFARLLGQASQQLCLLSMAGFILPLQSQQLHQSLKRFPHPLKAAAAVEAETDEGKPEPEGEEPNDNTILETGAELGNVQTPASVWLPYATNQNGKVSINTSLPAAPDAGVALCMPRHFTDLKVYA